MKGVLAVFFDCIMVKMQHLRVGLGVVMGRVGKSRVRASLSLKTSSPIESES